ncbi:protein-disulfide isomerase [Catenuloplanes atrovinosus]|uniref:Protein-disulfide isomerase n=2 Tax=Catenuloplanes atrovinosus TaxID=137266 RepID=A0AAE4CCA7_9ACTN|nr:protein-disulfide isomerase [Catenuloplanes atrovinosus]
MVREQLAKERRRKATVWTSVVAAAVLLVAGIAGYGIFSAQRSGEVFTPASAVADGSGFAVGTGSVTVDVYEDFMCPACGQFESAAGATLAQLVSENKITVVYHPISILDRYSQGTNYSTRASGAAACAADGGKFAEYHQTLFDNRPEENTPGLDDATLISLGTALGLGDSFTQCVEDGRYKTWSAQITDQASERGVTGTPTIYVAGTVLDDRSPAGLTSAVDAAVK